MGSCFSSIRAKENKINTIRIPKNNYICKIKCGEKKIGNGFFCKIPDKKNNLFPALIFKNQATNIDFSNKENIQLTLNYNMNEETKIEIKSRIFYKDKNENLIIIEIKNYDNLKTKQYLEIESDINNLKKSIEKIELITYEKHYIGLIETKNQKDFNFETNCVIEEENCQGYPLTSFDNDKIIAIIKDKNNKVLFMNELIQNFHINFSVNKENEIKIEYLINEDNEDKSIRIFGDNFVNNNSDNCKIIVNGKEEKLCSFYNTENIFLKNNIFEIKLKVINDINDASSLFCFCNRLKSISNLSLFKFSKTNNFSNMFCGCELLDSLPDISNLDFSNATDINGMFSGCSSLISISSISNLDISKVKDISNLFSRCSSLKEICDISKWKTNNVTNMNNLFSKCSSLKAIPDISKWNTSNVTNMNNMFSECTNLETLPDISNWNIINVFNITRMFYKCSSLKKLPDISKWNTINIKHMISLFEGCSSLETLPNISQWNIEKVTSLFSLFSGCSSLKALPDISNWNTRNVEDMSSMFCDCIALKTLPNLSKWNTNNLRDFEEMFEGCDKNLIIPDKFK